MIENTKKEQIVDAKKYYIGLDCGTNSVGWAVTDEKYNLVRKKGKTLWGMRLFEEAETASDRRINRSNRRRLARRKNRIKLLQDLFRDEILKVDKDFYTRLRESFFLEEDKNGFSLGKERSKNTLFNDKEFNDKDYHKKYPTIWHLRNAIIKSQANESFDIRLYYLAIEHIIKHRGHFLREGELDGAREFNELWKNFCFKAEKCGFPVRKEHNNKAEELLKKKINKTDKKKQFLNLFLDTENDDCTGDRKELATLICGGKASLKKLFGIEAEDDYKISLSEGVFEEKLPEIEDYLKGIENVADLILAVKQIYDYIYLSDLLQGDDSISSAMVRNYNKHQNDLKEIKKALKPFKSEYKKFFQTEKMEKKEDKYYAAYIGKGYSEDKSGRRKSYQISQEDINKELKKIFEAHHISGKLLEQAEEGSLLPKQRGFAKGTIPQQLHHEELKIILQKLSKDYPSFKKETKDEKGSYNTKIKKIERIHNFKIPYYCGPMLSKTERKNTFSWADNEINEIVKPWNYEELVNLEKRADNFIKRMTNECTYIYGAKVLPKNSLLYQKYMVLNELNNLKINGKRIDNETKEKIFKLGFLGNELKNNITLNGLKKWMCNASIIQDEDTLSGTNEVKNLPKLSTYNDFCRILGNDFEKKYSSDKLEEAIELIVILNNERKILEEKIKKSLKCSNEEASALSKLNYKDWGKFSYDFLNGVFSEIKGRRMSIIEALWETSSNLMELLGGEYSFKENIRERNSKNKKIESTEITYENVKDLYCSPAVKRTVWQAIKIVKEINEIIGYPPAKIFLEVTRGEEKEKRNRKLSRRKDLIEKYKQIKTTEAKELLGELNGRFEDRDLQRKKLFLYYCQMGKCAYCGKHIDLEGLSSQSYDIDHIYPRSKTKDDSILHNLVLVHSEENRDKTNIYPIDEKIRTKMKDLWESWYRAEILMKEKYERLIRANPLTDEELANFISRQMVETSQSVKEIRNLVQQYMPKTKVVTVKARNVSDLRNEYGYHGDMQNGLNIMPEFIKIRELNDIHHAKDAYLNIVVGNVISSTFTDNPYKWVKQKKDTNYNYSILTNRIFRNSKEYLGKDNKKHQYPEVFGWNYSESIKIVSDTMKRNDVLWTKMPYQQTGKISDTKIVGKSNDKNGILPIKRGERFKQIEKYGGYNSIGGAYFMLIEQSNGVRKLVQVPIIEKTNAEKYIYKKYPDSRIIIPKILFKSFLKINGFPCHLAGRTGDRIIIHPAIQIKINDDDLKGILLYLKRIAKVNEIIKNNKNYKINCDIDRITQKENLRTFDYLCKKLKLFKKMPKVSSKIEEIINSRERFSSLFLEEQIVALNNLLRVMQCNASQVDISNFVDKAAHFGGSDCSNAVNKYNSFKLTIQSVTGIFEKEIDLKTVEPDGV